MRQYIALLEGLENSFTVYHGSDTKIEKFELDFLDTGNHQYGIGMYFATKASTTKYFGTYTHEVLIDGNFTTVPKKRPNKTLAQKLIKMAPDLEMTLTDWDENPAMAFKKAVAAMVDASETLEELIDTIWYDFYRDEPKQFLINLVKVTGYDGKFIDVDDQKFLVLYNPNKILNVKIVED